MTCISYIGYENLFESGTVTESSERTGFEKENAYDWRPYDFWMPEENTDLPEATLQVDLGSSMPADYFAMHAYDLDGGTLYFEYSDNASAWTSAFDAIAPTGGVVFKLFDSTSHRYWRIRIASHSGDPAVGVVAFGSRLETRGQQNGFVPPTLARENELVTNQSVAGNFLGQSVKRTGTKFEFQWKAMTAVEARADWLPFIQHAETKPFFFLWSDDYADEAAFCWAESGHGETPYLTYNRLDGRVQCRGVTE